MRSKNCSISKPLLAVIGVFAAIALSAAPGDLDLTFSGDGRLTDWVGVARAVAIQPDGMIVVAGTEPGGGSFAVARYNPDGSADTSFGGGDGKAVSDGRQKPSACSIRFSSTTSWPSSN